MARRARSSFLCLALSCAAVACGDDDASSGSDAGGGTDASGAGSARLFVELAAAGADGDAMLTAAGIYVTELRARNDRGGDLEPRLEAVGPADLVATRTIDLGAVAPATYDGVTMRVEAGDTAPALSLTYAHPGGTVTVETADAVDVDVRCDAPLLLGPAREGRLSVTLDSDVVFDEIEATGSIEGDVRVDPETDPERLAAVLDALADAWTVACELDGG